MNHRPEDLVTLFNTLFRKSRGTELVRGGDEPEYLPAGVAGEYAQVIFAHGYFASALHEISHWCIAGEKRRQLPDYGYWYCPDGRTPEQQRAFEQVEIKPQALEWLFSVACGSGFHISVDNLDGAAPLTRPVSGVGYTNRPAGTWMRGCRPGPDNSLMPWWHSMVPAPSTFASGANNMPAWPGSSPRQHTL